MDQEKLIFQRFREKSTFNGKFFSKKKMSSPAAKKSRFSPATVQLPSQPLPPSAALGMDSSITGHGTPMTLI